MRRTENLLYGICCNIRNETQSQEGRTIEYDYQMVVILEGMRTVEIFGLSPRRSMGDQGRSMRD